MRGPSGRDALAERTLAFLKRYTQDYEAFFISWQPRDRNIPTIEGYADVWDDLYAHAPANKIRALHHTRLNLGSMAPPVLDHLADFTNALTERYRLAWVNEDLGIWHLYGKILPYPLPPILNREGLNACIRNLRVWGAALHAPLRVEFPGFSDGASFSIGNWHAYDYFREVVQASNAQCTLDVGHLLGWQWQQGRRGEALFEELERLPLKACREVHLSGCSIVNGRFVDAHHGVLLEEQFSLLEHLLPLCPNLEVITYEDPRFDAEGVLLPPTVASYMRLRAIAARWCDTHA